MAHRIRYGISAEFLFLQHQLPPGSPLNTNTLLPACICPGGSSAWREPPLALLVDIPSCSSQLYLKVTFSMRPTVHPITQPPALSPHTYTLDHLHQSTYQPVWETLPSLTRLIVMLCPFPLEHTAHGRQGLSVVSSLSSPRCKKSVSCLCHTTNISSLNGQ